MVNNSLQDTRCEHSQNFLPRVFSIFSGPDMPSGLCQPLKHSGIYILPDALTLTNSAFCPTVYVRVPHDSQNKHRL
jgi:hypothetical protein